MLVKTSDLIGPALDWAVAKCEGFWFGDAGHQQYALYQPHKYGPSMSASAWNPSTDPAQAYPIIFREKISVWETMAGASNLPWSAITDIGTWAVDGQPERCESFGETPLIAAMRCFVASRLGDEVEVPDELK